MSKGEKGENADEAVDKLRDTMRQIAGLADRDREERRTAAMAGPTATASDLLVWDPDTRQRRVFYAATPLHYRKIGFKLLRRAELKYLEPEQRETACWDWPVAVKVRVLRSCLVEPALPYPESDEEGALEQWAEESMPWQTLDDLVACIYMESRHVPKVDELTVADEGAEKGGSLSQRAPPIASSTTGSTRRDTATEEIAASTN